MQLTAAAPQTLTVGMVLSLCQASMLTASNTIRYLKRLIEEGVVPVDEPFCEVFQLWVDPSYRRFGVASEMKMAIENDATAKGCRFMYTHTRETNQHVVALNIKLGYNMVRTGTLWDDIVRVSLVKRL